MPKDPVYRIPSDYRAREVSIALAEQLAWPWKFLKIEKLWEKTRGLKPDGSPVKVAVLDTGIDVHHDEFVGRIADAKDFTRSKHGPQDIQGHGTWCCSSVGAKWRNNTGGAGIAPECVLYSGKVLNDQGWGNDRDIVAGIEWACEENVDFISMSFGGPTKSPLVEGAINAALKYKKQIFPFAASGNDGGSVNYPAALVGVIGVGASDEDGNITSFTSRGPELDIIAPGKDIVGCAPNNRYQVVSGTSMATPIACGVAALAFALDPDRFTDVADLEYELRETAATSGPWRLLDPVKLTAEQAGLPEEKPLLDITLGGFRLVVTRAPGVSKTSKLTARSFV